MLSAWQYVSKKLSVQNGFTKYHIEADDKISLTKNIKGCATIIDISVTRACLRNKTRFEEIVIFVLNMDL